MAILVDTFGLCLYLSLALWLFLCAFFYSLVSVTLFIFKITTFYITFIQKISYMTLCGICVRFLFLYQLFSIRTMDFFVLLFFFCRYCLRLLVVLIEKNKTSYMLFHFFFLVEKMYIFLCAYKYIPMSLFTVRRCEIKLQDMLRAVKKFMACF